MSLRIFVLVFFLFFARITSYSQVDKNSSAVYNSVPGMVFPTNDCLRDQIGIYKLGESLGGVLLNLDSNMHFQKRIYADICGCGLLDSGTWFFYKPGKIGLKSKNGLQTFDLLKYRHFYYCIPSTKRAKFVDEFLKSLAKFKNIKPIHVGDSVYTGIDLAAFSLMKHYYFRDLNDQ